MSGLWYFFHIIDYSIWKIDENCPLSAMIYLLKLWCSIAVRNDPLVCSSRGDHGCIFRTRGRFTLFNAKCVHLKKTNIHHPQYAEPQWLSTCSSHRHHCNRPDLGDGFLKWNHCRDKRHETPKISRRRAELKKYENKDTTKIINQTKHTMRHWKPPENLAEHFRPFAGKPRHWRRPYGVFLKRLPKQFDGVPNLAVSLGATDWWKIKGLSMFIHGWLMVYPCSSH